MFSSCSAFPEALAPKCSQFLIQSFIKGRETCLWYFLEDSGHLRKDSIFALNRSISNFFPFFPENGAWAGPILGLCGKDSDEVATLPWVLPEKFPRNFYHSPLLTIQASLMFAHIWNEVDFRLYAPLAQAFSVCFPPSKPLFMVFLWPERSQLSSLLAESVFFEETSLEIWLSLNSLWPHFLLWCLPLLTLPVTWHSLFLEHARLTCLRALVCAAPFTGMLIP